MASAIQTVQHQRRPVPGTAPAPPERIGPWRVVSLAGEGAWTRVYRAAPFRFPADSPADYAVKVLHPELQHDPTAGRLLQREELVGRQVTHPHLAPVLSSRIDRKPFFVTTPFLIGMTLRDCLASRQTVAPDREALCAALAVSSALWVARQVAEALLALHTAGWLHGDVKPSNVHVAASGHVTLLDLGFARRIGPHLDAHAVPWDALHVAGTPAYAAPEIHQARPDADSASDIYSLGVMLYEMLTGRWPFETLDARQLAAAHCHEAPPDPREWVPHVPARIARLLLRMLAKPTDGRPLTAELVEKLIDLEIATFGA